MKILLINEYYPPVNNGGVQRVLKMQKYFNRFGNQTIVLTKGSRIKNEYSKSAIKIYDLNDSTIFHSIISRITKFFKRKLKKFNLVNKKSVWANGVLRNTNKIIKYVKPDVIVASFPSIQNIELGIEISKRSGIPLVIDLRDGILFEPVIKNINNNILLRNRLEELEKEICESAKIIITTDFELTNYFKNKYSFMDTYTIPNGYDHEEINNENIEDICLQGWDDSKFNIVYTGRLQLSDSGVDSTKFIETLNKLVNQYENINMHFIGEYSNDEIQLFSSIKPNFIFIHPLLNRDQVINIQRKADLLLLIVNNNRRCVTTGKIYEYIVSGTPILGIAEGTRAAQIIRDTNTGIVVNNNCDDIEKGIKLFLERAYNYFPNREEIKKYSRETQMKEYITIINTYIKDNKN